MATKSTKKVETPAIADRALELLERGYEANVNAVSTASKRIADVLPTIPAGPLATRLPEPEKVVLTTFAVIDRLLDIQKQYALKLVAALAPVREKVRNGGTAETA